MKKIFITIAVIVFTLIACVFGIQSCRNTALSKEITVEKQLDIIATTQNEMFNSLEQVAQTVKQYSKHEANTLKEVIAMRTSGNSAADVNKNTEVLNKANLVISAVHEAYPELKADKLYLEMTTAIQRYNSKVAASQKAYANAKADYNIYIKQFPQQSILRMLGYESKVFEDLYTGESVALPNQGKPKLFDED